MTTALLLVDVQRDFFARPYLSPRPQDLIDRLGDLLKHCRTMGLPILHVRTRIQPEGTDRMPHWQHQETWACVAGTPGYEPPEDLDTLPGEQLLHKSFFSAFSATDLQPELEKAGITDLIIAGLYTHGCIRATVLDAYERSFRVWVADDAIGSTDPVHAAITCDYLNGRAAVFMPSVDLLERALTTHLSVDTETTRFHQLRTPRDDRKPGERV
jgi:aldehyde dehydrogenase (NAD+)